MGDELDHDVHTTLRSSLAWKPDTRQRGHLTEKLALFSDHWKPRTVARLNDLDIMVVKVQGEFVWQ
jgi:hypothetical protein